MKHLYFQSARERQIEAARIEAAKQLAREMAREEAILMLRAAGMFEAEIMDAIATA